MRNSGFTLIELMVAIALSTVLLLVAVITFRAATESMADLDRLANENALIRAGYFAVTEDVDYWHSHANPSFPYLQAHAADDADPESLWHIRPMRRVTWPKDLDDPHNPNWRQPHDPRAWYRNGLTPNVLSGSYRLTDHQQKGEENPNVKLAYDPTIRTPQEPALGKDGVVFFDTTGAKEIKHDNFALRRGADTLAGWDWWHLGGDYASLSNIDGWAKDSDGNGVFSDSERSLDDFDERHDHPQGMIRAASELGYWGVDTYMPPGTMSLLLTSSVNTTSANIPLQDKLVRRGEIPWMYQSGGDTLDSGKVSAPANFQIPNRRGVGEAAYDLDAMGRSNWFALMPDHFDCMRSTWKIGPAFMTAADLSLFDADAPFRSYRFIKASKWTDGAAFNSTLRQFVEPSNADLVTQAMVFPQGPQPTSLNNTWNTDIYGWATARPLQAVLGGSTGSSHTDTGYQEFRFSEVLTTTTLDAALYTDARERNSPMTWHVPVAWTGDPNPDLRTGDAGGRRMATSIFRERYHGSDRAECQVRVTDAEGATAFAMKFSVLGSSLRGARHYWGRMTRSAAIPAHVGTTSGMLLGDRYE